MRDSPDKGNQRAPLPKGIMESVLPAVKSRAALTPGFPLFTESMSYKTPWPKPEGALTSSIGTETGKWYYIVLSRFFVENLYKTDKPRYFTESCHCKICCKPRMCTKGEGVLRLPRSLEGQHRSQEPWAAGHEALLLERERKWRDCAWEACKRSQGKDAGTKNTATGKRQVRRSSIRNVTIIKMSLTFNSQLLFFWYHKNCKPAGRQTREQGAQAKELWSSWYQR